MSELLSAASAASVVRAVKEWLNTCPEIPEGIVSEDAVARYRYEGVEKAADQIKALFDVMEPGRTYKIEPMPEEQRARTRAWLDSAGGRGLDLLPPEVNELVREEISAYLKGVGTAEDCAEKIQSRVSIWLEENR